MPPTLVSRPGRPGHCEIKDLSVPRMLQTPGDASVGEKRGSIKQGRRHATKRFTARPRSGRVTSTHTHSQFARRYKYRLNRFEFFVDDATCPRDETSNHHQHAFKFKSKPRLLFTSSLMIIEKTRDASNECPTYCKLAFA